jgi:hypothetical protein
MAPLPPAARKTAETLLRNAHDSHTVVVATMAFNQQEMAVVLHYANGPALQAIARRLLVEALDLMQGASDDRSIDMANAIEAAIGVLHDFDGNVELEET